MNGCDTIVANKSVGDSELPQPEQNLNGCGTRLADKHLGCDKENGSGTKTANLMESQEESGSGTNLADKHLGCDKVNGSDTIVANMSVGDSELPRTDLETNMNVIEDMPSLKFFF